MSSPAARSVFFILLTFSILSWAEGEPSAFDLALQTDTAVETHESNAEYFSVRYRKIETGSATFYIKSIDHGGPNAIEVYCGQPKFFTDEHLKEGGPVIFRRTRKFIAALNESCSTAEKKKAMDLELEPGRANKEEKPAPGAKKKAQKRAQ